MSVLDTAVCGAGYLLLTQQEEMKRQEAERAGVIDTTATDITTQRTIAHEETDR